MLSRLRSVRKDAQLFGWGKALYSLTYRAVNRVLYFKILKVVKITRPDPQFLECDPRFQCRFLDRDALLSFSREPRYDLSEGFLRQALAKGDECHGITDGEVLASYGWYAHEATPVEDDLLLRFNKSYVYMYKGYTQPEYRGQRLHAIGMTMALQEYLDRGYQGLLSYVEAHNFSSLKSCYRMGYEDVGKVYVARLFGRYFSFGTRGARDHGFAVEQVQPAAAAPAVVSPAQEQAVATS